MRHRPTRIIAYPDPSMSSFYRIEQVFKYLNRTGKYDCVMSPTDITDEQLLWADIIFAKHLVDPQQLAMLWAYQVERGKKIVTDRDDLLELTDDNPFKKTNEQYHATSWSKELIKIANVVICTTQTIADNVKPFNDNIVIIPNYLDMELWDLPQKPNDTGITRIGWAGSITHSEDLKMVMPQIRHILLARDDVKFVCCSDNTVAKELASVPHHKWEIMPGMLDKYKYPAFAHSLLFDIGIAPLVENKFNQARSFLKYLEYAMIGAAGVYSPTAFSGVIEDGQNGYLAHRPEQWERRLTLLLDNPDLRASIAKGALEDVRHNYSIARNIDQWANCFTAL